MYRSLATASCHACESQQYADQSGSTEEVEILFLFFLLDLLLFFRSSSATTATSSCCSSRCRSATTATTEFQELRYIFGTTDLGEKRWEEWLDLAASSFNELVEAFLGNIHV